MIALLLGCGVVSPAFAASGAPNTLSQFLAKRFKPGRGIFGAIASALPVKLEPTSMAGMEGGKPDGSYWTNAFFNSGNVAMFDAPRKALAKFCASSGGIFRPVRPFDLRARHDSAFGSASLAHTDGQFVLPNAVVGLWVGAMPDGTVQPALSAYGPFTSARAAQIDASGALGLFICEAGNTPKWHVAILPAVAGDWRSLDASDRVAADRAVMLSVRVVDREAVDRARAIIDAKRKADADAETVLAARAAQEQAVEEARGAAVLPTLRAFQSNVKGGDETSCGLVLDVRGPLVEVQVPDGIRLDSGASRLFVNRTSLAPLHSAYSCYRYNPIVGRWMLAPNPSGQAAP